MRIEIGVNPNCSECAFVIYKSKLDIRQKKFVNQFIEKKGLRLDITPKGNITIEVGIGNNPSSKSELSELMDSFKDISDWLKLGFNDTHYQLIRDESYDDMIENKEI